MKKPVAKKRPKKEGERGYTQYRKNFVKILTDKADNDPEFYGTRLEVMRVLKCGRQTYYNWKKQHKEFEEALEYALETGLDKMEHDALLRASGRSKTTVKKIVKKSDGTTATEITETINPPDTRALIFYLTNKRPEEWREKVDVKHNGNITVVFEAQDEGLL